MRKAAIILFFAAVIAALTVLTVSAESIRVYIDPANGSDASDGSSASSPVKTLERAYALAASGDATVVLMSDYSMTSRFNEPAHTGTVTVTSNDGSVSYGSVIKNSVEMFWNMAGPLVFRDISFQTSKRLNVVCSFNPVVFDTGIQTNGTKDVCIIGGYYKPSSTSLPASKNSYVTVNSGDINMIVGFTKVKGAGTMTFTGTSYITVNGGTVKSIYGASQENHLSRSTVITVNGGTVNLICTGGDVTRRLSGDAAVYINGGNVLKVDFNNVTGEGRLYVTGAVPKSVSVSYASDVIAGYAEEAGKKKIAEYNGIICPGSFVQQLEKAFDVTVNTAFVTVGGKDPMAKTLSQAYAMLENGGKILLTGEALYDLTYSPDTAQRIVEISNIDGGRLRFEGTVRVPGQLTLSGIEVIYSDGCVISLDGGSALRMGRDVVCSGSADITVSKDAVVVIKAGKYGKVTVEPGGTAAFCEAEIGTLEVRDADVGLDECSVQNLLLSQAGDGFSAMASRSSLEKITLLGNGAGSAIVLKNTGIQNIDRSGWTNGNVKVSCCTESDSKPFLEEKTLFEVGYGDYAFVSDGADGEGYLPDDAMSDLKEAVKLLEGAGSVVLAGDYTVPSKIRFDAYDYEICITGKDPFGRDLPGAINMNASLYLGGPTVIDFLTVRNLKSDVNIYACGSRLEIGGSVMCEKMNGLDYCTGLVGISNADTKSGNAEIVVGSGTWGYFRLGSMWVRTAVSGVKYSLKITGGEFEKELILGSFGDTAAEVDAEIHGGTFYRGICLLNGDEISGNSYRADYKTELKLYGGTFYGEIIPSFKKDATLQGSFDVYVYGGDYGHLTGLAGSDGFFGRMTSNLYVSEDFDYTAPAEGKVTFTNYLLAAADPWLFYHDGFYYFTSTGGSHVSLRKVANIADLKYARYGYIFSPASGKSYSKDMWSPEIHYFSEELVGEKNAGWYMFICCSTAQNSNINRRAYVLKCLDGDDLTGRWGNPVTGEVDVPIKMTDPDYPAFNENELCGGMSMIKINGKCYLTFVSEVERGTASFHQTLNICEFVSPWELKGTPVTICVPEYSWETGGYGKSSTSEGWYPKVVEGSTAVYGDNGEVYIMYSGSGYWTIYYNLCWLKYTGGDPLNASSWQKNTKGPVFSYSSTVNGCGHASYFTDTDGTRWVCYHAYVGSNTSSGRFAFVEPYEVNSETVVIGNGSGHPASLDTVYTVNINPMPLSEKISGFAALQILPSATVPADSETDKPADTDPPAVSDNPEEPGADGEGSRIWVIAVCAAAAAVAVAAVCVVAVKGKKRS